MAKSTEIRASALLRSGKIFIQASLPTTAGLFMGCGPVYTASPDDAVAACEALRTALSIYYRILPHPKQDEWPSIQRPMLQAAGVRSWNSLAKGSKAVHIVMNGAELKLTPTSHYERKGGTLLEGMAFQSHLADPQLGAVLLEAFARCE